jgi:hypothetical protein
VGSKVFLRVAKEAVVKQMSEVLDQLGISLFIVWSPDETRSIHGEIKQRTIYIYDRQESDAFATFTHEIIEFKLKEVTRIYRTLINNLIDGYEKLAYQKKEEFIEFIPRMLSVKEKLGDSVDS